MTDFLQPALEISVVIPGVLLAYLPAKAYLKQPIRKLLFWLIPLLLGVCIAGGMLCGSLRLSTGPIMLIVVPAVSLFYAKSLNVSKWKSISVALAVCAVFSCVNSLSRAYNAMLTSESGLWFHLGAGLFYNLTCWLFVLLAWYPATHAARLLMEDPNMAQTWYVFWMLPLVFIGLNLFMIPRYEGTLYQGRIMWGYIVISLVLLGILALFYAMFLLMANSLNQNARLQQENAFLAMQQTRYEDLRAAIEETRHARHDMRHHFHQLSMMAENGELERLKAYLATANSKIPNLDMQFSENQAADRVIGYYCALAGRDNIPFFAQIDLPKDITIDEMDMCLVLSNLLENALEASLAAARERRYIHIEVYMHSAHLLLIRVDNAYDGEIRQKDGVFRSTKRKGSGVGIQSVRRISEKHGGGSSFAYDNGVFTAKVMLRSE